MDGVDGTYAPWHRQNMAEQGLVSQSRYEELLKGKHSVLTQTIGHTGLFAHLRSLDVLNSTEEEEIRFNAPTHVINRRLLDNIHRGPTWKFHGLLRACALTNQEHIISQILNMDSTVYNQDWC